MLDNPENIKNCLVHIPGQPDIENIKVNVMRYTLKDLTNKICNECRLKPPRRLKNLESDKYYT